MIDVRNYTELDLEEVKRIHAASGLPPNCMPALANPLFFMRKIISVGDRVALAGFLKLTSEAYVLVDHEIATPEWRYMALQKLTGAVLKEAAIKGVDDVTAFLPPAIEPSFGSKLVHLGFTKSEWPSYSVRLD